MSAKTMPTDHGYAMAPGTQTSSSPLTVNTVKGNATTEATNSEMAATGMLTTLPGYATANGTQTASRPLTAPRAKHEPKTKTKTHTSTHSTMTATDTMSLTRSFPPSTRERGMHFCGLTTVKATQAK